MPAKAASDTKLSAIVVIGVEGLQRRGPCRTSGRAAGRAARPRRCRRRARRRRRASARHLREEEPARGGHVDATDLHDVVAATVVEFPLRPGVEHGLAVRLRFAERLLQGVRAAAIAVLDHEAGLVERRAGVHAEDRAVVAQKGARGKPVPQGGTARRGRVRMDEGKGARATMPITAGTWDTLVTVMGRNPLRAKSRKQVSP